MNFILVCSLFLGFCLEIGYASSNGQCLEAQSPFPPEPESGCCGLAAQSSKILFRAVDIHEFPWLALIEYRRRDKLETFCGGTLISGKYVLTAAHCVVGTALSIATPENILLGEYDKRSNGPDCVDVGHCTDGEIRIPIEKIIPHNFEQKDANENDIALIRMKETAPYTDFIRPICLPTADVSLKTEPISFKLVSWGTTLGPSPVKVLVDLPFVTKEKCQSSYASKGITLGKGQLCAGGRKGYDTCRGDAGMPLIYRNGKIYEVIGLVSFGSNPCGAENVPSVYTNIYEYKSWITNNIDK